MLNYFRSEKIFAKTLQLGDNEIIEELVFSDF